MYRTPKIHKLKCNNINDLSLRLIISSKTTYNLAKFLCTLLKPVISIAQNIQLAFVSKSKRLGLVINF